MKKIIEKTITVKETEVLCDICQQPIETLTKYHTIAGKVESFWGHENTHAHNLCLLDLITKHNHGTQS